MMRSSSRRFVRPTLPLVSFLSGKGGVGKSVISSNIACNIASRGLRTLLVDFDLHCGNQHILLNQSIFAGLPEVLAGKMALQDVIIAISPTLSLLPSAAPLADAHRREAGEQTFALLESVARQFDFIVVDHPSGMSVASLFLAEISRMNVVVAIPDLLSLSDAFGLYKHLSARQVSGVLSVLVNRCRDKHEADDVTSKFSEIASRFIGQLPETIGFICESGEIRDSVASQTPLSTLTPHSPVMRSMTDLTNQVLDLSTASVLAQHMGTDSLGNEIHKTPAYADIKD